MQGVESVGCSKENFASLNRPSVMNTSSQWINEYRVTLMLIFKRMLLMNRSIETLSLQKHENRESG
jgi:hypothetical protein